MTKNNELDTSLRLGSSVTLWHRRWCVSPIRCWCFALVAGWVLVGLSSANLSAQNDVANQVTTAEMSDAVDSSSAMEGILDAEFLGVPLFDDDFYKLLVRLSINLISLGLVVGVAYRWHQNNKSYVFTFFLMNLVIFFICFTLKKLEIGMGMALGLFAIFAIIRYRTDAIKVKEMTYLFVVIGLAVINSLSNKKMSYAELLFTNAFLIGSTLVLEGMFIKKTTLKLATQELMYDKIELLQPGLREELIADLQSRTGLDVRKVDIKKIDLTKGSANIAVRYPRAESQ